MSTASGEPVGGGALEIELLVQDGLDATVSNEALVSAAAETLARIGIDRGHVAIEIVDESRIQLLNNEHRAKDAPTDVLSFPVDGEGIAAGGPAAVQALPAVELGDVVINPDHTEDMVEAVIHGVLHLCGYDHEVDDGQMLELQDQIHAGLTR